MNKSIIQVFTLASFILFISCSNNQPQSKNDWQNLFNGKDLSNWFVKIHHHDPGVNFGNTFRVEDNMIKVRYDNYQEFNDQFRH